MSYTLLAERASAPATGHAASGPALSTTGWLVTAGLCVLAIAIGTAVGHWWGQRHPSADITPSATPTARAEPLPTPDGLTAERAALVQACIRIRTLTSDPALQEIADDGLAEGGVITVIPTGQRFDPHRHQSVGELPTADPAQDCIIARTDRPGYEDHGRRIRPAEVLVLRFRVA